MPLRKTIAKMNRSGNDAGGTAMRQDFAQLKARLEQLMPVTDLDEIGQQLARLEAESVERSAYDELSRRWDRRKRFDMIVAIAGIVLGVIGIPAGYWLSARDQRLAIEASHVNLPIIAKLAHEGKWTQARRLLDEALLIAPADPTLLQQKAHLDADEAARTGKVTDGLTDTLEHYAKRHPADAKLRVRLAQIYYILGSHESSLRSGETGRQLAARVHDEGLVATAEHTMAMSLIPQGKTADAVRHLTHASTVFCATKDDARCASSLYELARLAFSQENYMASLEYLAESEARDRSERHRAAVSLLRGETLSALERYAEAAESLSVAVASFEEVGDERGVIYSLAVSGQIASRLGRCDEARRQMSKSRDRAEGTRMYELVLRTNGMSGEVEENCNNPDDAYRHHFASWLMAQQLNITPLLEFSGEQVKRMRSKVADSRLADLERRSRRYVDSLEIRRHLPQK